MKKTLLLLMAVITSCAYGQGVFFNSYNVTSAKNVSVGAQAPVLTLPFSTVSVCVYDGNLTTPCTTTVPIYTNQDLAPGHLIPQPLQSDNQGRFQFWIAAGIYKFSVNTAVGTPVGTYALSLDSPVGPQGPGGIGCGTGNCIVQAPAGAQNIQQPAGTTLGVSSINGSNVPGFGFASIQAAVTSAQGAGGEVDVPGTLAAGEMAYPAANISLSGISTSSYKKFTGIPVDDHRPLNHDVSLAQMISLPATDGAAAGGDTIGAQRCVQTEHCVVAVVGNSIHENVAAVAPNDGYTAALFAAMQRKFPDTQFTFINLSIGGSSVQNFIDATYICNTTPAANHFFRSTPGNWYLQQTFNSGFLTGPPYFQWTNGCTPGNNWMQELTTTQPDIVVLGFVENEYSSGTQGYIPALQSAINFVRAIKIIPPTVILTTDMPPNPNWDSTLGLQDPNIFEGLNEATRGIAAQNNLLLADADRYYNVLAYGIDPGRRHFQVEHSFLNYHASGWAVAVGANASDFPALSGSGLASTITYPTPAGTNGGMVQRTRNATDFVLSASFGQTQAGVSVPSIWYRMTSAALGGLQFGYKVQTSSAISGSNTIWSITLYYSNGVPQTVITSGVCTIPTAVPLVLTVQVSGAHHDVWCNTTNHVISAYDYFQLAGGQVAVGIQSGPGNISNEYIYYGNPTQYFTPIVGIQSMMGTQVPPTYNAAGDFDTNPFSYGGDGYHHPSPVGFDSYYMAAFKPVLDYLAQQMTVHSSVSVAHTGFPGNNYGGLEDSGDGRVDVVNGPQGGRVVNNANNFIRERWNNGNSDPHIFAVPVQLTSITNGVGMQVAGLGSSCHPAANSFCTDTITLPVAEPNTSYFVLGCSVRDLSGGASTIGGTSFRTTTTFQVLEVNPTATAAAGGFVECLVTH